MDALKYSRLGVAIAGALLITACSEEVEPPPPNTPPTVTVTDSNPRAVEGDVLVIPYELSDADQDVSTLTVTLTSPEESTTPTGDAVLDKANSEIRFTAPWLSDDKIAFETLVLEVTDAEGATAKQNIVVQTEDINSPVKVVMHAPQSAFGYQNTQEDTKLNFWFPEGEKLNLTFDVKDEDTDTINMDYAVTEGLVFRNQIEAAMNGEVVTLGLDVPEITTAYESFAISLTAEDGDDTIVATANVTIVNQPRLTWTADSDTRMSERDGGKLSFTSSESKNYNGVYDLMVTAPDGGALDFNMDYDFDPADGTVTFGASSGFQGQREMLVTLTLTSNIPHAGGENYKHVTELTRTVIVLDDRDDDFNVSVDKFYEQVDWLQRAKERQDERRVASSLGNLLFLERDITFSEYKTLESNVGFAIDQELDALESQADAVIEKINAGTPADELYADFDAFSVEMKKIGHQGRGAIHDTLASLGVDVSTKSFSLPQRQGEASLYDNYEYTHYVGNGAYGFYVDQDQKDWEFRNAYKYLLVADITNTVCFARDSYELNK